jgi:RNA polymerase sigma-70 factor (ECF subfamily)
MEGVIARAAAGEADALGDLWRAHNHLLLRYFRGKGMREPDDLASTVWLEVVRGLSTFAGDEDDFRRWLFTIAARRRIDQIRTERRRRDRDDAARALAGMPVAPAADVDAERAAALDRAIALVRQLPRDQAEAVLLRVVADLSVADVATIMRRTDGNVRVLVHRGLKRLAAMRREDAADTATPVDGRAGDVTNSPGRSIYAS